VVNSDYEELLDERRAVVAFYYLNGASQTEIAEKVGCCQGTVSLTIKGLRDGWVCDITRDRQLQVADAYAKLKLVEQVACQRGDVRAVMKAIDLRMKILGAYKIQIVHTPPLDWDAVAAAPSRPDPVEQRLLELKRLDTNGDNGDA
jgi:hypothetical protein